MVKICPLCLPISRQSGQLIFPLFRPRDPSAKHGGVGDVCGVCVLGVRKLLSKGSHRRPLSFVLIRETCFPLDKCQTELEPWFAVCDRLCVVVVVSGAPPSVVTGPLAPGAAAIAYEIQMVSPWE